MKNKKLIIFDLQGTLVKSMRPPRLNGCKVDLLNLIERGYTLSIFTGGSRTEVSNILTKLGIVGLFKRQNIITKQSGFPSKPNPQAIYFLKKSNNTKTCIYCGDTFKDYELATTTGIHFIYFGKKKLGVANVTSISELLNLSEYL